MLWTNGRRFQPRTMQPRFETLTGCRDELWLIRRYGEVVGMGRYGLVTLKLKHLSRINSILGRAAGDLVLCHVYRELCLHLNAAEYCIHSHGGSFRLLLRLSSPEETHTRLRELLKALADCVPFPLPEGEIHAGAGVYWLWEEPSDFYTAAYCAEFARKNSPQAEYHSSHYEIYGYSTREEFRCLMEQVPRAIANGDIKLYLQPKVELKTGKVQRAEALMRWEDPKLGGIPLYRLMPALEQSGLIRDVDLYLFEALCRKLRLWGGAVSVSVNLSKAYFEDSRFLADYTGLMDRYRVPPEGLEIEFLESIAAERLGRMKAISMHLQALGIGCALDDFGSGCASFQLLSKLELEELKIDRSLFSDFENPKERTVVRHIVEAGRELHMRTVAEGVENPKYLAFLRGIGCDCVQSYAFYRPMPAEEFEKRFIRNS